MLYLFVASLLSIVVKSQFDCSSNDDCTAYGSGWTCDLSTSECAYAPVTCSSDDQCSGALPVCYTAAASCIACTVTSDCTSNTEYYGTGWTCIATSGIGYCSPDDTTTDTTTTDTCTSNTDCSTETPYCDTSTSQCAMCVEDIDCDGNALCTTSPSSSCTCDEATAAGITLKYCNPSSVTTGCQTDADCSEYAPYCDSTLGGICQASITNGCTTTDDCPDILPICIDELGICQATEADKCVTADQCYPTIPLCNTDTGYCYACDTDLDCQNNLLYGTGFTCESVTAEGITVPICCQQGGCDIEVYTKAPTTSDGYTTSPTATKVGYTMAPTPSPTGIYNSLSSDSNKEGLSVIIIASVIVLAMVSWM